jgi:hypothetical protein
VISIGSHDAHPEGWPSSAIAGVNGSRQVAAAERSATRTYLMSSPLIKNDCPESGCAGRARLLVRRKGSTYARMNVLYARLIMPDVIAATLPRAATSRVLKKSAARGQNREHNGIQRSPNRNRTAAEMSARFGRQKGRGKLMLSSSVSVRETRGLLYQLQGVPRDSLGGWDSQGAVERLSSRSPVKRLKARSTCHVAAVRLHPRAHGICGLAVDLRTAGDRRAED